MVNEYFFDKESRAMRYVLGASYPCYNPIGDRKIIFRSSHKDLVQIVKDQLDSEYKIISDPRGKSSYWIEMHAPYLNSKLGEMGLNVPKKERKFPEDIPVEDGHLVRGFLDGQGYIWNYDGKSTRIIIEFNNSFLVSLHQVLVEYVGIERDAPKGNRLTYGHKDSLKIYDFIYQDWLYIKKNGLYLPTKKALFRIRYKGDRSSDPRRIAARKRIDKAKKLLLQGLQPNNVAQKVGYSNEVCLYLSFKKITDKTIGQWLEENTLVKNKNKSIFP